MMLKKTKIFLKTIPVAGAFLIWIRDRLTETRLASERRAFKKQYPLHQCGVNQKQRAIPVIVSLTSIKPRLKMVPLCIRTLLSQSFRPDKVVLWLSEYDMHGNKVISRDHLPRELLNLTKKGLDIRFCKDIGPYRKLIPALKEFPDAVIVTADDDAIYPKDWLEKLYVSYQSDPGSIHCYRPRLISFNSDGKIDGYLKWNLDFQKPKRSFLIFPLGVNGVLYPPHALNDEIFNEDVFLEICPKADDIWFKAMSLQNNTCCRKVCLESERPLLIPGSQVVSLFSENEYRNDEKIDAVFKKYGLCEKLLNINLGISK